MLGLRHGVNLLVDYDPGWVRAFDEERSRLFAVLGEKVRSVEHYGSTAVPGLRAKPIMDILVGVATISQWVHCKQPLERLGYDYAANAGVPEHHIFGRGRDKTERTHLVHVVEFDGPSWRSNLAFRDALRSDPSLRAAYELEKERAITAAPTGRPQYNMIKRAFIDVAKAKLPNAI
jgi:GrpB-like predicted nucleotidyltransferase (UPF0157 family)